MTLRMRLALGIAAIAIALVAPLLVSARSLRQLSANTAQLRDRELAATRILGRLRSASDELLQRTDLLALFPSDSAQRAFEARITVMTRQADSLQTLVPGSDLTRLRSALGRVWEQAQRVVQQASAGRSAQADSLVDRFMRPTFGDVQRTLEATELSVQDRTRESVDDFAAQSEQARRWSALALGGAALLALLIAIWLTQSVSRPLDELDEGMRAVADGDLTRNLPIGSSRRDEFGRLAASYRSMSHQLRELDRLKNEFISVASHELKTPINVIGGYLRLLQEGVYGELSAKQRETCQTLGAQTHQLSQLVRQLLDVSRFEAGGGKLELRNIHLAPFLTDLERAFRVLALQREVVFHVIREGELPRDVVWDGERMNEVLGNILSNAFKFTPTGGAVELRVASDGDNIQMRAHDTGAGIPREQLRFIFHKFYQADNQDVSGIRGTGLGLAIAKSILTAHGGTIAAESTVGEGTTFTIVIPIRAVATRLATPRTLPVA